MNLYSITFPNGKKYIGVESNEGQRWRQHCKLSRSSASSLVSKAIRKHGIENCVHEYLAKDLDRKWCLRLERTFIKMFDLTNREKGYNLTLGGEGTLGMKHSEATKKVLSERTKAEWNKEGFREEFTRKHKGVPVHSEEYKKKVSAQFSGKVMSDSQKEAIGAGNRGKKRSDEVRQKISEIRQVVMRKDPTLGDRCAKFMNTPQASKKSAESRRGIKFSAERNAKLSASLKANYASGKRKPNNLKWSAEDRIRISNDLKQQFLDGRRVSSKGIKRKPYVYKTKTPMIIPTQFNQPTLSPFNG